MKADQVLTWFVQAVFLAGAVHLASQRYDLPRPGVDVDWQTLAAMVVCVVAAVSAFHTLLRPMLLLGFGLLCVGALLLACVYVFSGDPLVRGAIQTGALRFLDACTDAVRGASGATPQQQQQQPLPLSSSWWQRWN